MNHARARSVGVLRFPAAAAVAAVLVLGGCSGPEGDSGANADEGPLSSADPGSGSSSVPSIPRTPTVAAYKPASAEGPAENVPLPVMPDLAKVESKEGLEAFAAHWYALVNYGYETGDLEPIKGISGGSCVACNSYYPDVEEGFSGEDWMVNGAVTVRSITSAYVLTEQGRYQVLAQISQESIEYYGPSGLVGQTAIDPNELRVLMIEAIYNENGWFADDVVTIQ